ncbi:hypothetical protein BD311DRAFT_768431 [Dichomitus squalens]|uniref:Uncharacterized protein n=1 Tax=Dichomitus squalens TaxID=114155 RepID=A0A4Q9MBX4_9APHY|nr:hypothetical protein BD311DRAFT_768431 [Dichomitus squalens]
MGSKNPRRQRRMHKTAQSDRSHATPRLQRWKMVALSGITSIVVAFAAWAYATTPATPRLTRETLPPQAAVSTSSGHFSKRSSW